MTSVRHWRATVAPLAVLGAAVAIITAISARDPHASGNYPTCPFLLITGHYCPGCGTLRALYSLGHGNIGDVFARNPAVPLASAVLGFIWVAWLRRRFTGKERSWAAPPALLWLLLGAVLLFWVLRNIPGWDFLAP
ncbi:MAG: DUF2752 domain-containing protein [Angustibacter sp.]